MFRSNLARCRVVSVKLSELTHASSARRTRSGGFVASGPAAASRARASHETAVVVLMRTTDDRCLGRPSSGLRLGTGSWMARRASIGCHRFHKERCSTGVRPIAIQWSCRCRHGSGPGGMVVEPLSRNALAGVHGPLDHGRCRRATESRAARKVDAGAQVRRQRRDPLHDGRLPGRHARTGNFRGRGLDLASPRTRAPGRSAQRGAAAAHARAHPGS